MSDKHTEHPELRQLIDNLYQAGMSIEQVIEHGFELAKGMQYIRAEAGDAPFADWVAAAQQVRAVVDELEIGRAAQHAIWLKNQSGLGKGHVRLLHDE